MTRYSLHVPVLTNDGAPLQSLHDAVRAKLGALFGGFTELHGDGYWSGEHPGHEPIAVYVVDSDAADARDHVLSLARTVKREAAQDAVYVTAQDIQTILV